MILTSGSGRRGRLRRPRGGKFGGELTDRLWRESKSHLRTPEPRLAIALFFQRWCASLRQVKTRSPQEQLAHLHMLNRRGRLALFVGAGVSFGCGFPTWTELIDLITERAYPRTNPESRAVLAKLDTIPRTRLLKSKLKHRFKETVADSLYSQPYQLSDAIQQLAMAGIQHICTYNFDELIEEALQLADVEFNSITSGEAFNSNFRGTVVFHPHGLLTASMDRDEAQATSIVLSEEDYHELYSNPYSWANLIQLSLLINYTCLFVGVSLTDPNLRRLLDVCKSLRVTHRHYAIMRSPAYAVADPEKPLAKQVKAATEAELRSLNVEPLWIGPYDEIGKIFKRIRVPRPTRDALRIRPSPEGRTAPRRSRRRK